MVALATASRVTDDQAAADANRAGARRYSLSALQRFSICPYQFLLATIYRLEPGRSREPLLRLDPLTRGSLFHEVQAEFLRTLQAEEAAARDAGLCSRSAASPRRGA